MAQFKTSQMFTNCLISLLWALLFKGKLDEFERLEALCRSMGISGKCQWDRIYEPAIYETLKEEFIDMIGDDLPTMEDARLWAELRDILQSLYD